jgi:ABC-2 type transport system permease protein
MRAIQALLIRNLTNFTRDKLKLFFTLFMSVFFLFIFSFVMKLATSGIAQPMNYLISGIIIMTVFQGALNNSMNILEDISSGFMKEILVAPISRWQISIGQVLSSAAIAVLQGFIVLALGLFIGLKIDFLHFAAMTGVMVLVGVTFSALGLYLATLAKTSSTFQLLISMVMMPLVFLSGAYIPTVVLPACLLPVVYLNPLTYTTAIFRFLALHMDGASAGALVKAGVAFNVNGFIVMPQLDVLMIAVLGGLFLFLCVRRFDRADFSKVKVFKHGHH